MLFDHNLKLPLYDFSENNFILLIFYIDRCTDGHRPICKRILIDPDAFNYNVRHDTVRYRMVALESEDLNVIQNSPVPVRCVKSPAGTVPGRCHFTPNSSAHTAYRAVKCLSSS